MAKHPRYSSGWLKALRQRLGLLQHEIAEKVGVARRTWMYYERGKQKPSKPVKLLLDLIDNGTIA